MYVFLTILILLASLLLIGVVLIQKSKGGGLASNFSSSNQIMGVRKTTDFVEKATWTLAIVICVLSIVSSFLAPQKSCTRPSIACDYRTRSSATASYAVCHSRGCYYCSGYRKIKKRQIT